MKLTVYFNGQYWVGVIEQQLGSRLKACQHIFGAEPQDGEVMAFVQHHMLGLLSSTNQQIQIHQPIAKKINPKRLARQVAGELHMKGISSHAQDAMKLALESRKKERKAVNKRKAEEFKEMKHLLKVQKAKEKHRGR